MTEFNNPQHPTFRSSVKMLNIYWFEQMLGGEHPLEGRPKGFKGLLAPKWADAAKLFPNDPAWNVEPNLVRPGPELYQTHCVECHRRPVSDSQDTSFWDDDKDWVDIGGRRYLDVVQKPVEVMGTDKITSTGRASSQPTYRARPPSVAHLNSQGSCELPGEELPTTSDEI